MNLQVHIILIILHKLHNFTKLKRSEKGEVTWSEYLSVSFLILLLGYEI